jgi:hypothetical protein
MKSKTLFSVVLLAFVAVSIVFALRKVTPDTPPAKIKRPLQAKRESPRRRLVSTQSLLRLSSLRCTFMLRIDAPLVARLKPSRMKR